MGETHPTQVPQRPTIGLAEAKIGVVIAVGVSSFFTGVGATLAIYIAARPHPPAVASSAPSADPLPPLVASSSPSASPAPPSSSAVRTGAPSPQPGEEAARRALAKLREGIGTCVRDVIGVLPGSSPPVPVTMKLMKNGVYTSLPSDFRSPVFACTHYKETEPQSFQIQWQRGATPNDGAGIAWVDDNGDGQADRAFGFRAKLVRKKEVTLGEIEAQDPMPKPLPVR